MKKVTHFDRFAQGASACGAEHRSNGAYIIVSADKSKVTCKRCLKTDSFATTPGIEVHS